MALLWAARQLVGRTAGSPPLPNVFVQLASLGAATPTQHLLSQAATLQPVSTFLPVQPFSPLLSEPATPFNLIGPNTDTHSAAFPRTWVGTTAGDHHISGGSGGKLFTPASQSAGGHSLYLSISSSGPSAEGSASGLGSSAEAGNGPNPPAAAGSAEAMAGAPLTDPSQNPTLEPGEQGGEPPGGGGGGEGIANPEHTGEGATRAAGAPEAESPKPSPGEGEAQPHAVTTSEESDSLLTTLRLPVRMFQGSASVLYVKNLVETDFHEPDFLESAMDAFYSVQQLFMKSELELLSPMVSPAIMAAFEDNIEVRKEDGTQRNMLELDVAGAVISDVQFLSAAEYSTVIDKSATAEDRKAAQEAATLKRRTDGMNAQYAINKYIVISVLFSSSIKTEEIATSAAGEIRKHILTDTSEGFHAQELEFGLAGLARSNIWKFAKGPLPARLPVSEVDGDWTVVGVANA